jgi:glutathione S-transferase
MKLFSSPTSPFARKVRAVAIETGVHLELVDASWLDPEDPLHKANPLGRLPALVRDNGQTIVDSPVICEYLDSLGSAGLFPVEKEARWRALTLAAYGDGVLDSAVHWRQEQMRPLELQSQEWMDRRRVQISATLAHLQSRIEDLNSWSIGSLTIACAWDYLVFRFGDLDWHIQFPALAQWHLAQSQRPCLIETRPQSSPGFV